MGQAIYFIVFVVAAIMVFLLVWQQANYRPGSDLADKWYRDPGNWKMGVFYFNPEDKRIFPPKRVKGFGWTINFANPFSVIALFTLIALIVMLIR